METERYDSRPDTMRHAARVQTLLKYFSENLDNRGKIHDVSKLVSPEVEAFDLLTPKLKLVTYGSEEYRTCLREMKPAIEHHYACNSHHPEHFANGIDGMNLMDVVEMFCDWKAASERHENGDFAKSIQQNKTRFSMSDQLVAIFENTRKDLGL